MSSFNTIKEALAYLLDHAEPLGLTDAQIDLLHQVEREAFYVDTHSHSAPTGPKAERHFLRQAQQLTLLYAGILMSRDPFVQEAAAIVIREAARYLGPAYAPLLVALAGTAEDFLASRGYGHPSQETDFSQLSDLTQIIKEQLQITFHDIVMVALKNDRFILFCRTEYPLQFADPVILAQVHQLVALLNENPIFRGRVDMVALDTADTTSFPVIIEQDPKGVWSLKPKLRDRAAIYSEAARRLYPRFKGDPLISQRGTEFAERAIHIWREAGEERIIREMYAELAALDGIDPFLIEPYLNAAFAEGPNPHAIANLILAVHQQTEGIRESFPHSFPVRLSQQPFLWVPPHIYLSYASPIYSRPEGRARYPFEATLHHEPGIFLTEALKSLYALGASEARRISPHPIIARLRTVGIRYDISLLTGDLSKLKRALDRHEFMIEDSDGLVQAVLRHRFAEWVLRFSRSRPLPDLVEGVLIHATIINPYLHNQSDNLSFPTSLPLLDTEARTDFVATLRQLEDEEPESGTPPPSSSTPSSPARRRSSFGSGPIGETRGHHARYTSTHFLRRAASPHSDTAIWQGGIAYGMGVPVFSHLGAHVILAP